MERVFSFVTNSMTFPEAVTFKSLRNDSILGIFEFVARVSYVGRIVLRSRSALYVARISSDFIGVPSDQTFHSFRVHVTRESVLISQFPISHSYDSVVGLYRIRDRNRNRRIASLYGEFSSYSSGFGTIGASPTTHILIDHPMSHVFTPSE